MATKRYKRDFKELEKRRQRGMRLLARGIAQAEVARTCAVSRQTAMSWARMLETHSQAWRRIPLGRPGSFDSKQRAQLIEREFGRSFSISYVWRLLHDLGFSPQRPVGRASQRDEEAIRQWKQKRWPALKKTLDDREEPSSSSTN